MPAGGLATAAVIGGAGKLITGGLSFFKGRSQKKKADALEKQNVRPVMSVPQAIKDNAELAKSRANTGLSGAVYGQQQQAIDRSATSAIRTAQGRGGALAAAAAIQQNTNDAELQLNSADEQQRNANVLNLMQQNQTLGAYQQKAWEWNDAQKFQENAAAIRALRGAAEANTNNAINSVLSVGADVAGGLMGGGGATAPVPVTDPTLNSNLFDFNGIPGGYADFLRKKAAFRTR